MLCVHIMAMQSMILPYPMFCIPCTTASCITLHKQFNSHSGTPSRARPWKCWTSCCSNQYISNCQQSFPLAGSQAACRHEVTYLLLQREGLRAAGTSLQNRERHNPNFLIEKREYWLRREIPHFLLMQHGICALVLRSRVSMRKAC